VSLYEYVNEVVSCITPENIIAGEKQIMLNTHTKMRKSNLFSKTQLYSLKIYLHPELQSVMSFSLLVFFTNCITQQSNSVCVCGLVADVLQTFL